MRTRNDRFRTGMFWFAVSLPAVSILAKGHSRLLDAVIGAAGAIFVVSLGRLAFCRLRVRG